MQQQETCLPLLKEMRTRGVANLQVSGDARTGNLSPFVEGGEDKRWGQFAGEWRCNKQETCLPLLKDMRTRGVANLQVSGNATTGNLSPFVEGDEDKRWGQFEGEWRCSNRKSVSLC